MNQVIDYLNELYPNPKCELNYNKDYELLIAVVLSAQTTDNKVNLVTKKLFEVYPNLEALRDADVDDIKRIIKIIGTYNKKAVFIKQIANILLEKYDGIVPNNHKDLESLPGVGHKTANVVLSNIYDIPAFAVDTHVSRVSKRLGLANESDSVEAIEKKVTKLISPDIWGRTHHQLVLFGRYHCRAIKPNCSSCKLKKICKR